MTDEQADKAQGRELGSTGGAERERRWKQAPQRRTARRAPAGLGAAARRYGEESITALLFLPRR